MSKVSDMVKMYSQSNPTTSTADKQAPSGVARKWPPVATAGGSGTNKPPITTPAPNFGAARPALAPRPFRQHEASRPSNVKNQETRAAGNDASWRRSAAGGSTEEHQSVPQWKIDLKKSKEDVKSEGGDQNGRLRTKTGTEKPRETKPAWMKNTNESVPSWAKPKPSSSHVGPLNPNPKSNIASNSTTVPWSQRNQPKTDTGGKFPSQQQPDVSPKPGVHATPKIPTFTANAPPKSTVENSSSSSKPAEKGDKEATSPEKRMNSFLHMKRSEETAPGQHQTVSDKPPKTNGVPTRLKIPREKYSESPPSKMTKPPTVVLPHKGKKKFSLPSLPTSFLSRSSTTTNDSLAGKNVDVPPPPHARNLPPVGSRELPPPPMDTKNLPPPALPSRTVGFPPPSLPCRPPSSPRKKTTPLPPPPEADDTYDDFEEELQSRPSFPPPLVKKESSGLIPTWDDEVPDAIYDETPDDGSARPPIPAGFPTPSNPAQMPEESEEMYEDVEEYMRLKKLQTQQQIQEENGGANGNDGIKREKKKREAEKKEKELRKKFRLPMEGDIVPEGRAVAKETSKAGWGRGGLSIAAGEEIEVIRMSDNPKGKWLVRNSQGEYGYVESEKVQIDVAQLRNTFGIGGRGTGAGLVNTDEAIYDETAEEDIYEEV